MSNHSSSILHLNIIPDVDTIDTFGDDDETTLPNESYTISGTVEINLLRPIQIRQLYVQLKGTVNCVISTSDFFQSQEAGATVTDEIPMSKWNTVESSQLGFVDRIARKAMGHANASLTIAHERIAVVDEPQVLGVGKTSWPFSLKINNMHKLPPSTLLPHHSIQYSLSAKIKLNSLSERFKMTYWNACMNIHSSSSLSGERKLSTGSSETTSNTLSTIATTSTTTTATTTTTDDGSSIAPPTNIMSRTKNKRQLLGAHHIIQICRHSYPSLYSLYSIPRIRYRGSRQDHLRYEIGMSKFTCLQKKLLHFSCRFDRICDDAIIESMEYYLEQLESYPYVYFDRVTHDVLLCHLFTPHHVASGQVTGM
ncbi:hypothetical protein BD408DRAFT_268194 [Parasitella parasitica]|nr:hypothetical protein BD408DRAFT_268194 [Parasitella parasitica]